MRKTKTKEPTHAQYLAARKEAQEKANKTGFDYGLEWNYLIGEFHSFILSHKKHRCGRELRCEVVMCENLKKCQPGHGPG